MGLRCSSKCTANWQASLHRICTAAQIVHKFYLLKVHPENIRRNREHEKSMEFLPGNSYMNHETRSQGRNRTSSQFREDVKCAFQVFQMSHHQQFLTLKFVWYRVMWCYLSASISLSRNILNRFGNDAQITNICSL